MDKQHNVTFLSYFPIKGNHTSLDLRQPGHSYLNFLDMGMFTGTKLQRWLVMNMAQTFGKEICEQDFRTDKIRKFLNDSGPFDVIVTQMFTSDCYLSFMHKFEAPVVGVSTFGIMEWVCEKFGLPSNPAYVPNVFSDLVNPITFARRIDNFLMGIFQKLYYENLMASNGEKTAKEYFGEGLPSLSKIAFNVSMLLVNAHFNSRERKICSKILRNMII